MRAPDLSGAFAYDPRAGKERPIHFLPKNPFNSLQYSVKYLTLSGHPGI